MNDPGTAWITPEWLAALTALVAVVVGPLVTIAVTRGQLKTTLRVAAQQYEATAVSAARSRWLEQLREAVAELLAAAVALGIDRNHPALGAVERQAKNERAYLVMSKVMLLLNTAEKDHLELIEKLTEAMDAALSDLAADRRPENLGKLSGEIASLASEILKAEWERIKKPSLPIEL